MKICSVKLFVRKSILIFIDLPSVSSSDDSTCIIITNLVMEIKMCHLLSFWILFPVKIVQKHVCTSCMHFELLIEQVSVLIQSPACMHASFHACSRHSLYACMKMHAKVLICMAVLCMPHACSACMIHSCSMHAVHACTV